ncbi:MAG: acetyl-CoA carboxylase biotin carboxyl carrier protein [Aristaeellaceae bacterium]
MTNQEIFELLSRFEGSSLRAMKVTRGDFSLEMERECAAAPAPQASAAVPVAEKPEEPAISAPLAGVFYAAAEPGGKPYAAVGDRVRKGDTVCLMEAMKMISEIAAPCDLIVTEILKGNGELAAYGEPLMRYRPC